MTRFWPKAIGFYFLIVCWISSCRTAGKNESEVSEEQKDITTVFPKKMTCETAPILKQEKSEQQKSEFVVDLSKKTISFSFGGEAFTYSQVELQRNILAPNSYRLKLMANDNVVGRLIMDPPPNSTVLNEEMERLKAAGRDPEDVCRLGKIIVYIDKLPNGKSINALACCKKEIKDEM